MKFTPEYIIPIVILVMVSIFSLFSFNKMFVINENYSNKGGRLEYSEYVSDYSADQTMMPDYSEDQTMMPDYSEDQTMMPDYSEDQTMMPDYSEDQTMMPDYSEDQTMMPDYSEDQTMMPDYSEDQTMMPDYSEDQTMMPDADYETTPYDADYETTPYDADYETTPQEGFATFDDESDAYDEDTMIDTYSQARGGSTCEPGPYSNSSGYLCLDNNQKRLLMTRGMNQSGSDSQIGQD